MLTLVTQPNTVRPLSKSRPIRWTIGTTDHVTDNGSLAFFTVTFLADGIPNGQVIEIAGETYTTDDSTPYTNLTFDASGTKLETAENFLGALRSNYRFAGFDFFVSGGGGDWGVTGFSLQPGLVDDWTFDITDFTVGGYASLVESNGTETILKNYRLWYRIFVDELPITPELPAHVPFDFFFPFTSGRTIINATEALAAVVRSTPPNPNWIQPILDPDFYREFHLQFGSVEMDANCNAVYGQVYQTVRYKITNSVFQLEQTGDFVPHAPNFTNEVEWLTNRPDTLTLCRDTYEWIHIWIQFTAVFLFDFRVVYNFYEFEGGPVLSGGFIPINVTLGGAYIIPIGTANALAPVPANAYFYTFQIVAKAEAMGGGFQYIPYSTEISRNVFDVCSCKAEEVYFLEGPGSWRTVQFDKIDQIDIEQEPVAFEQPLDYTNNKGYAYITGGRHSRAATADKVQTLITPPISNGERGKWEEFLTSPEHYLRVDRETETVVKRIIIDRQRYTVLKDGEAIRLAIPYRFNHRLEIHK